MTNLARLRTLALFFAVLAGLAPLGAQPPRPLQVVASGPSGEIAALAAANEIRVVFSEPMVALGRIPDPVAAPFVRITPAIRGTFRWSGTTILIFTPDPATPLPYATTYHVTVESSATAASGRRLAVPHSFSFTTPTVRLLATRWYRKARFDSPVVVALRFNQPVRAADVLAHATFQYKPHEWERPFLQPEAIARLRRTEPAALVSFDAKVTSADRAARAAAPVRAVVAADWDRKRYPQSPDLVVLETAAVPPPESWIELTLDNRLPSVAGPATPPEPQRYTLELERAFFVRGSRCSEQCDPSYRNPIELSRDTSIKGFAAGLRVTDITDQGRDAVVKPVRPPGASDRSWIWEESPHPTLEDAGFERQPPARTYALRVDPAVEAADGQRLGYAWTGIVANWHESAFTSFGDGHGVWEPEGGRQLPFYARNFRDVTQWALPLSIDQLVSTVRSLRSHYFRTAPAGPGTSRRLTPKADAIQSHGLDLSGALSASNRGLVWVAVREGEPIAQSRRAAEENGQPLDRSSIVQVTNLGISVKDSPQNSLIFVARLDTGAPVAEASVSIIKPDNTVFWRGTTNADGVAIAPETALRPANRFRGDYDVFDFIVVAEKAGDVAYVVSDWDEGIEPWQFGHSYDLDDGSDLVRGSVFTDRGVYKPGEEVRIKAILRADVAGAIRPLAGGAEVVVTMRDSQNRQVDRRTVRVNAWSSAEWTYQVPAEASLGQYSIRATYGQAAPRETANLAPREIEALQERDDEVRSVQGSFLVAAYRRPDFRVDVTLTGGAPTSGTTLTGRVDARYLFGGTMANRPVKWTVSRAPLFTVPASITERFPGNRYEFVGYRDRTRESAPVASDDMLLDGQGRLVKEVPTEIAAGIPYQYTFEADIEDVSRQHIANRASLVVHPAPWYIGLKRPRNFVEQKSGLATDAVVTNLDGEPVAGVDVDLELVQVQYLSARRAEGGGFYTWESERRETVAGRFSITSGAAPVPLSIPLPSGGSFVLRATAKDPQGRVASTHMSMYVLGSGFTAWERYDHNRIDLETERTTYRPGETARILIRSPWDRATALVTTEREGIRSHRRFAVTSTQQTIDIPVTEGDIPNVFVSVLLIRGRTPGAVQDDGSDPGKPAFRLGYVELLVHDAAKRLTATIKANREEYRPANTARVDVDVRDSQERGVASEVTLWAVDHGVLALTEYRPPDVASQVYTRKSLQVMTLDSRQRIISRRVLTPKGTDEGGGGGVGDPGAGAVRKDFRALAFWLGSVTTNANGRASVDVRLPESLTTYRIMAVAADRASRFGTAESDIRISKPVTLTASFPRFLTPGDSAFFGAVVTNQSRQPGTAVVTMRGLNPGVLEVEANAQRTVELAAGAAGEVRFDVRARAFGRGRIQMSVRLGSESDSFEDIIPVNILSTPEAVAAYGETSATARESLSPPAGAIPGFGGLRVELASTAMVGLGEGAHYLVDYPYGCAEQRASSALALVLASDLGSAFSLPGLTPAGLRTRAQATLRELETFQCEGGGFAYWPGACFSTSPYLTSYVLHVMRVAASLGYTVSSDVRERGYSYLERALNQPPAPNEGWSPGYTAWQAFAIKVLVEGGRQQDSNLNRLYGYLDRMPVFALAHLHDALVAKGETGSRRIELQRRISNAILPEGGSAHVEELSDPYLLWFWNSNIRSTAIALGAITRGGEGEETLARIRPLVRWLMAAREEGRWGNTQENAWAMESLVAYYRKFERETPDFSAVVSLGVEELARTEFRGRSTQPVVREIPLSRLAAAAGTRPLEVSKQGTGTLFYGVRLRYALDSRGMQALDNGFSIERSYSRVGEDGLELPAATSFSAGDLVRVTLRLRLTKERRFVAVTDPLPAGLEPVESWFRTTASALAREQQTEESRGEGREWWQRGGFDHVERHDDRVQLFGTRLSEGDHEFSYMVRATTAGVFETAPAHAEEMYAPEVFGRTSSAVIRVER